ncbi:hypothetical protein bb8_p01 [Bordetella phage vB_BbrP_BB8]|uniref:Uncharacterized protein n=1 Tax=Bordetella phage vB_BbrP_BB8 TaxID=2587820 RepID=A0A4Y5TNQ8_9CAUD|nr:hypothetical protein bb8_p01 [Bordetella phage vB_BbrP_BB8]
MATRGAFFSSCSRCEHGHTSGYQFAGENTGPPKRPFSCHLSSPS